ncbi:MAG: cyclopropane-fatty-acyl-phospholipid synthase family protein [Xanthomonadales bacterium]|jgi:cyclopropane-fatty-acyl-phospholipid synthase|nr:cyclopropane-fatty-acyl-phospholipid synthase family protein [Xanthomonadales bacterium]
MKATSLASSRHLAGTAKPGRLTGLARKAVLRRLEQLTEGGLVLVEGTRRHYFGTAAGNVRRIQITVQDPRFYSEIAFGGSIGAGEAYMSGYWQCDDLVALIRLLLRNRHVIDQMEGGLARMTAPLQTLFHRINRNSREGARRNIAAHYDLGNDFFALWLDQTMMYSSAIFQHPETGLHAAQLYRLDRICQKLDLQAGDHVIEIGTGWGGFAIHAAQNYGCRVTTTTISEEQYQKARQRVVDAGLHDRITVLRDDFRDLDGRFDKLVSIEMIEAIDHELFDVFFRKCGDLLKADGAMLIQAITIADQRYEEYRRSVDFIQRYIFPGSGLPSSAVMTDSVARQTDMRLLDLEDIGLHYATTLNHWRRRFLAQLDEVRRQGYSESFVRMWEFYLCYCEGAFEERAISDVQILFSKPDSRIRRI